MFEPTTDYSVALDFKKEYVRHKRVLCSIKEFLNFDIQNKWDIGYCKTFCHHGNNSNIGLSEIGVAKAARAERAQELRSRENSVIQNSNNDFATFEAKSGADSSNTKQYSENI